jgi:hypothetical protein
MEPIRQNESYPSANIPFGCGRREIENNIRMLMEAPHARR